MDDGKSTENLQELKKLLAEAKSSILELQKYQRPDSLDAALASKEANKVLEKINLIIGDRRQVQGSGCGLAVALIIIGVIVYFIAKNV